MCRECESECEGECEDECDGDSDSGSFTLDVYTSPNHLSSASEKFITTLDLCHSLVKDMRRRADGTLPYLVENSNAVARVSAAANVCKCELAA